MEYDAERTLHAPLGQVWAVAADVDRMPEWVPGIEAAAVPAADTVDVHLADREVAGLLRVDADQRRVEWGSRGTAGYAGWLQVHDGADDAVSVHLHLSMDDEEVAGAARDVGARDVATALQEALTGLAAIVERPTTERPTTERR